jgi:glucose/arabinose dehydrogenase
MLLVAGVGTVTGIDRAAAQTVRGVQVNSGLALPVDIQSHPSDPSRLFICEQRGTIKVIENGTLLGPFFLDINSLVIDTLDERGLLGMAFHPDYDQNGYFFVHYVAPGGTQGISTIRRYSVTANPNVADPNSGLTIMTLAQPFFNHNAGQLAFGPNDGYLYISFGDGGSGGDPSNRAQNDGLRFGKMLRVDINGDDFPADPGNNYAIPPDNPFVGAGNPLDEIWAKGLRNPWRFAFDPHNGDLYIGDVGQENWEEINYTPGTSTGGENYGWKLYEANACFSGACNPAGLQFPIHAYSSNGGPCSVTGGVVYRGSEIPGLCGTYFFADWCNDQIWSFRMEGGVMKDFMERTAQIEDGFQINALATFGVDALGEMYFVNRNSGLLYKIEYDSGGPLLGDFDSDGDVDAVDFATFAQCFGGAGNPPSANCPPGVVADLDCDIDVDLGDFATLAQNFTGSQ